MMGLVVSFAVAQFQGFPGYLDSDYYFAGGLGLASGRGFREPYLWNYLDDPQGLPHPSPTYWMPLASLIAAAGLRLFSEDTYGAGRAGFILLASFVPVVTAILAYSFSRRRDLAIVSGLLGVFSIYYLPFLPVPDNYDVYLVVGGLFFLTLGWSHILRYLALGILSGLLTLARTDGILWFGVTIVVILWQARSPVAPMDEESVHAASSPASRGWRGSIALHMFLAAAGFALIAGPWFLRTYSIYGTLLAPGGSRLLWLRSYGETFVYPATQLTFDRWLAQGWGPIVEARLVALKWNLLNAFAAQGGVFLLPFILLAVWARRRDQRVQVGILGWLALLFVMTIIFPFAGYRGGFFHSGAALQTLWWALAPLGLETAVAAARKRDMFSAQAFVVFRAALVGIAALMTATIFAIRVLPGWGEGEGNYPKIEAFLTRSGGAQDDVVMVRNPPGYFLMTGRPAIVVPYGDAASVHAAAVRYDAKYLVIEQAGAAGPIKTVYDNTTSTFFGYLGELSGTRIFRVQP